MVPVKPKNLALLVPKLSSDERAWVVWAHLTARPRTRPYDLDFTCPPSNLILLDAHRIWRKLATHNTSSPQWRPSLKTLQEKLRLHCEGLLQ